MASGVSIFFIGGAQYGTGVNSKMCYPLQLLHKFYCFPSLVQNLIQFGGRPAMMAFFICGQCRSWCIALGQEMRFFRLYAYRAFFYGDCCMVILLLMTPYV